MLSSPKHTRNEKTPNDLIMERLAGKKLGELTSGEMLAVINSLGPKQELYSGLQYLRMVLAEEGVKGVIALVAKGHYILDNEGKLAVYDFDEFGSKHRKYYRRTRPNILNRREFLNTAGWLVPGSVAVTTGGLQIADGAYGFFMRNREAKIPETKLSIFRRIHEWIDSYVAPPSEVLIGAALINESVEKWKEYKLEQIANAIAEIADLQERQSKDSGSPRLSPGR